MRLYAIYLHLIDKSIHGLYEIALLPKIIFKHKQINTFDIVKDGKYEAVIQNNHETVIPITVAMGSNSGSLAQSIVTTGVAVLLMGLFGMMATALYVFKLKRKT